MEAPTLLLVDVQRGILQIPVHEEELVVARLAQLLERARTAGVPVIHVQHENETDLKRGTPEWAIDPAVAPGPGEPVVAKTECDSFHGTTLAQELSVRHANRLIIGGCMSDWCIQTTVKRAVDLGYRVTLVSDGHSTGDSDGRTAAQIIAAMNRELGEYGAELRRAESIKFK